MAPVPRDLVAVLLPRGLKNVLAKHHTVHDVLPAKAASNGAAAEQAVLRTQGNGCS